MSQAENIGGLYVKKTRKIKINGVEKDLSQDQDFGTIGGGSPAGSNGELQTNDGGSFGSAVGTFWDKVKGFLGIGVITGLLARLTVKAPQTTITPPSSITITATEETLLDFPTVTTTEITEPTDPSNYTASISYGGSSVNYIAGNNHWESYLYTIRNIGGSYYYNTNPQYVDLGYDDNSSNSFHIPHDWDVASAGDGYIIVVYKDGSQFTSFLVDGGLSTDLYDDYGEGYTNPASISGAFSSIAFFPPSTAYADDPNSLNSSSNGAYGGYYDDGTISSIDYWVESYGGSPTRYYSNSSSGTSYSFSTSYSSFGIDLTWNSGGSQDGFKVFKTIHFSNGDPDATYAIDVGNTTSFTDNYFTDTDTTDTPKISSFSLYTTRQYKTKGIGTYPNIYYSVGEYNYTFTDSAPTGGYVVKHSITYGTTSLAKLLGQYDGQGLSNSVTLSGNTELFETASNIWYGDATITPNHVGIQSNSQVWSLRGYSKKTSPSLLFSSSYASQSYTFPSDLKYRYLTVSFVAGSSSTIRLLRNTGSGFTTSLDIGGTYIVTVNTGWSGDVTVTPNTIDGVSIIGVNSSRTKSDSAQVIAQSDATGSGVTNSQKFECQNSDGSVTADFGHDGVANETYIFSAPNKVTLYGQSVGKMATISSSQATFNENSASGFVFSIKTTSGYTPVIWYDTYRTLFLNYTSGGLYGSGSALSLNNNGGNSLFIKSSGDGDTGNAIIVETTGGALKAKLSRNGKMNVGSATHTTGFLNLGGNDGTNASMVFADSAYTSTVSGAFYRDNQGVLKYVKVTTPASVLTNSGSGNLTANYYPMQSSTEGQLINGHIYEQSGVILNFSLQGLFQVGMAVSSGQTITLGSLAGGTSANGAIAYDSTQKNLNYGAGNLKHWSVGSFFTQTNKVTVANSTTETEISGTGIGTKTIPANYGAIGKTIEGFISGYVSNTATPNLTIKFKFGSTVVGSVTIATPTGLSNSYFKAFVKVTFRTIGSTGTVFCLGEVVINNVIYPIVNTATTTINTTTSQALSFSATWGTASASNTISTEICDFQAIS